MADKKNKNMQKLKDEILREFDKKYGEFVFITGVESIRSGSIKQFISTAIDKAVAQALDEIELKPEIIVEEIFIKWKDTEVTPDGTRQLIYDVIKKLNQNIKKVKGGK